MTNPAVEVVKKQIEDAEMEVIGLNALIAALQDVPESSTQLDSLRELRKMFENNTIKLQDSIKAIK